MIKILYIVSTSPFGPSFGGQIRSLQIGRALQSVGKVSCLVVNQDVVPDNERIFAEAGFAFVEPIRAVASKRNDFVTKWRRFFDRRFLDVHGIVATSTDRIRVQRILPEFDLVWILNSRTPNILQHWSWPRSHLDIDDIPSTYQASLANSSSAIPERIRSMSRCYSLKRRERLLPNRFSTLSVCSETDKEYLGGGSKIHVIPNGFEELPVSQNRVPAIPPRLGFIGLMSYEPNMDGIRWFLANCWVDLRKTVPGIHLRLIGKGSENVLTSSDLDVDLLGWVSNPADEIATWSAMVIPIRLGGGTRVKIADAFSRKCPVVSSTLGAYGYEVMDGREIRIADRPDEFIGACVDLIQNPREARMMAERAHQAFLENWTWSAIAPRVAAAAEDCLRLSRIQS